MLLSQKKSWTALIQTVQIILFQKDFCAKDFLTISLNDSIFVTQTINDNIIKKIFFISSKMNLKYYKKLV